MITSVTVSPWSAAVRSAARQRSSGTRTLRVGVAGLFGTRHTIRHGVYTPQHNYRIDRTSASGVLAESRPSSKALRIILF